MTDAWRLAIGTFTRIPVTPPRDLDRPGRAVLLAPVIAGGIALPIGLITQWGATWANPWIVALLAVVLLAWITRAIHLDGLADTADALGSGQPAERALAIARQSDIGPFGVITLVLALTGQVIAIAVIAPDAALVLTWVAITSRVALIATCTPVFPAARSDGLGALVAGSIRTGVAWLAVLVLLVATAAVTWWRQTPDLPIATGAALLAGVAIAVIARRRFSGVTGDTMGATIEVAFTAGLIAAALSVG